MPLATGVLVSDPLDPAVLTGLPDNVCADAAQAPAAAVRVVGGAPVAVCFVADLTEGLWDVGIDTVPEAWRQRHGTAVFLALAGAMAEHGRQPVWAAYEDYPPSLAMAPGSDSDRWPGWPSSLRRRVITIAERVRTLAVRGRLREAREQGPGVCSPGPRP